jgi:hypothetical protein
MTGYTICVGRRDILAITAMGAVLLGTGIGMAQVAPVITVWKDPNCGCCAGWVDHLRRNGFTATVIETSDLEARRTERGVPPQLAACHTAVIAGYTIEGHVPALAISRLLAEKPAARGLAVPGMPIGSPGMEGGRPEVYDVMLFGSGAPSRFGRFIGDKPV